MRHLVLLPVLVALAPGAALAGLEFCNQSNTTVHLALGYHENEEWISQGWWQIEPGRCATPITGDLKQRYYYYFADATDPDYSFDDDDTNYEFCVEADPFTIHGDETCEARGYFTEDFNELDTGDSLDFTLTLE